MIESKINKELEGQIDLYVNGKLSEEQVDELWAELIQDEYYLDYTKSVANLKAVIEKKRKANTKAPVHHLRKVLGYGAAAAVALLIGVIGILNYSATNGTSNEIEALSWMDYGTVRNPETSSEILTDNEIIRQAISLTNNGNTEEAISLLTEELTKVSEPVDIAEISLMLGSIQYNYGNYSEALVSFNRVVDQESVDDKILEKAWYYLGNTYIQLDNMTEAKLAFEQTIDYDQQYSRVAQRYLDIIQSMD